MKRKIIVLVIFILSFSLLAEGWYSRGVYHLSPMDLSIAHYEGTIKNTSIEALQKKDFGIFVDYCQKLNKTERALLWGALDYYDVQVGEIYSVIINTTAYQGYCDCLMLYVEIKSDGNLEWLGKYCNFIVK